MIARADIDRLRRRPPTPDSPVLSVYLDVDQANAANLNRQFVAALDAKVRALGAELDDGEREAFRAAADRARDVVGSYEPRGKTLVLFADRSGDLAWSGELRIALPTDVRWEPTPHLRPLLEMLDEHARYGVILADKAQARLFTVWQAEIEEERETLAAGEVRHKKSSGTDHLRSQMNFQRQDDAHVHWHLRDTAAVMDEMARRHAFDRLILAGPVEATSELERRLPRPLADRVVETLRLPVDAPPAEVLERTLEVAERVERAAEIDLVARVVEEGVLGLHATLEALQQGRAHVLLYPAGLVHAGSECTRCRVLVAGRDGEACGYCGGPILALDDVVGRALERAREAGAVVEQVRGDAADRLRDAGGMGALLRF